MSQESAKTYADGLLESLEHAAAHITSGDSVTDYCERACLADGHLSTRDQALQVLDYLDATDKATADEAWKWAGAVEDFDTEDDYVSNLVDTIERVTSDTETPIWWEDGEPFAHPKCHLLNEDGQFEMDCLSLEAMKAADADGYVAPEGLHLKVTLTWGGPNAYLFRDWDEDRLEVYWYSDPQRRYGDAVTTVLDYFAEYAVC